MMLEGLHPNRPTHIMQLQTDEFSARSITDLLGEVFDPAETAVAAFETEDNGPWLIEAYFSKKPDEAAIRELARICVGGEADKAIFFEIEQKDWVKASLEGLNPVRAGNILVHGSHDREHRRVNDLTIEIEAALAFGTGHHGTTLGCLLALLDECRMKRPKRILDVGTGTGILGFAAAKLLKTEVIAGDIDPEAIRIARENARLNSIHSYMKFYVAPGVLHPLADRTHYFDMVLANILAKPLKMLAKDLTRVVKPDGTLILSGLLIKDVAGVLSTYRLMGWTLCQRYENEGWAALVLKSIKH